MRATFMLYVFLIFLMLALDALIPTPPWANQSEPEEITR